MSVLDEESRFPNATDLTFVNKLFTMASKDFGAYLFKTKVKADERFVFGINHYAGPVEYRAQGFLAKNRDTIPELFVKLMRHSEEPIFSEFFGDDGGGDSFDEAIGSAPPMTPKLLDRQSQDGGSGEARDLTARRGDSPFPGVRLHDSVSSEVDGTPRTPGSPSSARRRISSSSFSSSPLLPTSDAKKEGKKSLCVQFKDSLVALCNLLASTNAHYIRCVKPNVSFQPNVFLEEMVSNQLQYSGIVETIRVRLEGFPARRGLKNFCDVFMMIDLSKRVKGNLKESARALLTALDPQVQKTHWMIGDTKVFLKGK
jgi:myosin-3